MKFSKSKPWLKSDGTELSSLELKLLSATWSADTWNAYARYLKKKDEKQEEESQSDWVPSDTISETATNEDLKEMVSIMTTDRYSHLREVITGFIPQLTPLEQAVVQGLFFEGEKYRSLAEKLETSNGNIINARRRALKRLRRMLLDTVGRNSLAA